MKISSKAKKTSGRLGRRGEKAAARLLEFSGMTILATNYRCKAGELDIVALDGMEIVFVEVKTLRYRRGVTPSMNLSWRQRRRNRNAAVYYLKRISSPQMVARFDLIEVIFFGRILLSIRRIEDYLPPLAPLNTEA